MSSSHIVEAFYLRICFASGIYVLKKYIGAWHLGSRNLSSSCSSSHTPAPNHGPHPERRRNSWQWSLESINHQPIDPCCCHGAQWWATLACSEVSRIWYPAWPILRTLGRSATWARTSAFLSLLNGQKAYQLQLWQIWFMFFGFNFNCGRFDLWSTITFINLIFGFSRHPRGS